MLSLAGAGVGCDDDEPLAPKDAAADAVVVTDTGAKPDAAVVMDTATSTPDAVVDTATPKPDTTMDTVTPTPDVAPEVKVDMTTTTPDAGMDTVPALDGATDASDAGPDTATPDTAPDAVVVDTAPDTIIPADTAPKLINGCVTFQDGTLMAGDRYIDWGTGTGTPALFPALAERCLTVKVGQTVKFGGDFTAHPLAAAGGGDTPAIPSKSSGQEDYEVPFNTVGTFGYTCTVHASMTGAIHVIP